MSQASLPPVSGMREQLAAIATVRLQIFRNSLRTMRGRAEMVSWIFMGLWFLMAGLGGAFGLGIGAWAILSHGHPEWFAVLLWPIFVFWIFFPLLATAFSETFDSANLLRFPLRYSSFFAVNIIYGSLDVATMLGVLWLTGTAVGAAIAAPALSPWTCLVLAVFGSVIILLVRTLFSWIERWLAQRRTREIMGVLFFLTIVAFQLIGPVVRHLNRNHFQLPDYLSQAVAIQRFLPAGLAASSITSAIQGEWAGAVAALFALACYGGVFLLLLHRRLLAQYAGENLGEAVSRERQVVKKEEARSGWFLPGLPGQLTALMEKEVRYLSRSGPMLFTLVMPIVFMLILHNTGRPNRVGGGIGQNANLAFPIGAGYTLLLLTNIIYNSLGADGVGVQFLFVAPVRIRTVLLAKNLIHASVLGLEMLLVWAAAAIAYQPPNPAIVAITVSAILFGAPLDFCAGNLLSLYAAKKYDFSAFGRQRASGITVLASLGAQIVIIGVTAIVWLTARAMGSLWFAVAIFAPLIAVVFFAYRVVLGRVDEIALRRRESLIAVLAKSG